MDPDAALAALCGGIADWHRAADPAAALAAAEQVVRAAESLDAWLSGSGFAPVGWR